MTERNMNARKQVRAVMMDFPDGLGVNRVISETLKRYAAASHYTAYVPTKRMK
jgi:hypothetical protein